MKRNELTESVHDQPISQVEYEAANDDINEAGMQEYVASAKYYERCWRNRIKFHQRDWWIAIALYLILIGVAFVAL